MTLKIPIYERSKKYGYLYWTKDLDEKIHLLLGAISGVNVWLENSDLGVKKIDWNNRRISLGWKQTRKLSDKLSMFQISLKEKGVIKIKCQ